MIHLRKANIDDLEALYLIEKACFPLAEAASKQALKQRLNTFSDCFIVLEVDKKIVGMINGAIVAPKTILDIYYEDVSCHHPNEKYQSVFGLDILEEYRHQGYAHLLMKEMIKQASFNHKEGVILTCKQEKLSLYQDMGFKCLGKSLSTHGDATWYDMIYEINSKE